MRQPLPKNMRRLGSLRVRTWALIIWTVGAIATMIVARLTFARRSVKARRGRVLSQRPKPGAVRQSGYPVRLVVGRK
jgi:hypothetical protein